MDQRIIEDLIKIKHVNDLRILRMIRNVEPVKEDGTNAKQVLLYNKVKDEKLTHNQLAEFIKFYYKDFKKEYDAESILENRVTTIVKNRSILIKINLSKLEEVEKSNIKKFIGSEFKKINNKINVYLKKKTESE